MLRSRLIGLTPWQIAIVMAVFFVTLIGAMALVYAFKWLNARKVLRGAASL